MTMLLLPVALTDHRRTHWQATSVVGSPISAMIARSALLVTRLQASAIYLVAAVSKLGQQEWLNGTAIYYWFDFFDVPAPLIALVSHSLPVVLLTWGTITFEFALAIVPWTTGRLSSALLKLGILFHLAIALLFGLWSFGVSMTAVLVLYLRPFQEPFPLWPKRSPTRRESQPVPTG